ncbi:hypothetical protein EBU24_02545 [bacterium]|nr:hypothetical protein [bacterium]
MAEQYIPKPGAGSAFVNGSKTESFHGDYSGSITLPEDAKPGATYYINIFNNVGKNSGKPYFGLKIGREIAVKGTNNIQAKPGAFDDMESDVPF